MKQSISIKNVTKKKNSLKLIGVMGKKVIFISCGLETIAQLHMIKTQDIECLIFLKFLQESILKNIQLIEDGKLEIEWSEGNHTSYFEPNWLKKIIVIL